MPAGQRDRLERVCRYTLRPPLAEARITTTPGGDVAVQLRRAWADPATDAGGPASVFAMELVAFTAK